MRPAVLAIITVLLFCSPALGHDPFLDGPWFPGDPFATCCCGPQYLMWQDSGVIWYNQPLRVYYRPVIIDYRDFYGLR